MVKARRLLITVGLLVAALVIGEGRSAAATITVCPTGCTQTGLQAAIDAASPGDTILLNTTGTFLGPFLLRQKSCPAQDITCKILIRSGVTSTGTIVSTSTYPAANKRIAPTQAGLAKIVPTATNDTAIRTARVSETGGGCSATPCSAAAFYTLQWLDIMGNTAGGADLLEFGSQSGGADAQDTKAKTPHDITLDQNVIHGDPITGQARGMLIATRLFNLTNNYIYDIKSMNEAQAVWIENTTGDVLVQNNYISCGAECVFMGGDIPRMRLNTTVLGSPAPTATSITLAVAIPDWVYVGQAVSYFSAGVKHLTHVTSISGAVLGIEDRGLGVPDVGSAINMTVVQRNITVRKNWITRPTSWRNPIVSTPQSVTVSASSTGGTLACSTPPCTFAYRVVSRMNTNSGQVARSTASVEVVATIADVTTTGSVALSWATQPNLLDYRVYGRSLGGENVFFTVLPGACAAATCSFTDTGAAGTAGAVPTTTGSVWIVKNSIEMKKVDGLLLEGNVVEYCWVQAQTGYILLLTVANNSVGIDGSDSAVVRNVTVQHNIFRHATHFLDITMHDASGDISDNTRDILIYNNLIYDIADVWGGPNAAILFTSPGSNLATNYPANEGMERFNYDHNTMINTNAGSPAVMFDWWKTTLGQFRCHTCTFTNSIFMRQTYGLRSLSPGMGNEGDVAWQAGTDAGSIWDLNVIPGAPCSVYTGGTARNFCPTLTAFQASFANYAADDFHVTSTAWINAGTDGKTLGVDYTLMTPLTNVALTGDNTGAVQAPPTPPTISTASLPSGQVGAIYSTVLTGTGGTQPYTWTLEGGSTLPPGLTLTTDGHIQGTPTAPGTVEFTLRLTGGNTAFVTKLLSIAVNDALVLPQRPTRVDQVAIAIYHDDPCPTDPVKQVQVGDLCIEGSTTFVKRATATSPNVVWDGLDAGNLTTGTVPGARLPNLDAAILTTGTVANARLGTGGTPGSTTEFLNHNNVWAVPAGGTGTAFVNILLVPSTSTSAYTSLNASTTGVSTPGNSNRNMIPFDLTGYTQCREYTRVSGAATGATAVVLYVQYSSDGGTTWTPLWGTTPNIDLMTNTGVGNSTTAFTSIDAGAKTDVLLRPVVSVTGTMASQPSVGNMGINCK